MVARKRLALENNLVSPVSARRVKSRHEKMEIRRQRLHNRDLFLLRADHGGHHPRRPRIHVQPRRQRRVGHGLEVALDALRAPRREVL